MKIWCDVCDKEEASVFCCADEAALCHGCDRHVHFANKLAGKHLRFSLASPSFKDSPLCDICRERRALLFCQEDRAILCRECDVPIHQANEHTQRHNRFLLTGVKLSASPSAYTKASDQTGPVKSRPGSVSGGNQMRRTTSSVSSELFSSPSTQQSTSNCYYGFEERNCHQLSDSGSGSISEYLMETLPGWRVEDLLDHPSCVSSDNNNGFFRVFGGGGGGGGGSGSSLDHAFWEQ
ncbi:PREDICTED: B-box zinc finger protein 20 [Tarenaya hassleriana]|uniref:B-box zinc finger protein 20 n=1 Tax=Tarenaya hassleriana TaxID=28532 RepID=UPI00053C9BD6|nr:PREDICTED: B-box zinc finger protein 20 [Tarenaya hassleriana]